MPGGFVVSAMLNLDAGEFDQHRGTLRELLTYSLPRLVGISEVTRAIAQVMVGGGISIEHGVV